MNVLASQRVLRVVTAGLIVSPLLFSTPALAEDTLDSPVANRELTANIEPATETTESNEVDASTSDSGVVDELDATTSVEDSQLLMDSKNVDVSTPALESPQNRMHAPASNTTSKSPTTYTGVAGRIVVRDTYDGTEYVPVDPELYTAELKRFIAPQKPSVPSTYVETPDKENYKPVENTDIVGGNTNAAANPSVSQTSKSESAIYEASTATEEQIAEARESVIVAIAETDNLCLAFDEAESQLQEACYEQSSLVLEAHDTLFDTRDQARDAYVADESEDNYQAIMLLNDIELIDVFDQPDRLDSFIDNPVLITYVESLRRIKQCAIAYSAIDFDDYCRRASNAYAAAQDAYDSYALAYDHYYDLLICNLGQSMWTPAFVGGYHVVHVRGTNQGVVTDGGDFVAAQASSMINHLPATSDSTDALLPLSISFAGGLLAAAGVKTRRE